LGGKREQKWLEKKNRKEERQPCNTDINYILKQQPRLFFSFSRAIISCVCHHKMIIGVLLIMCAIYVLCWVWVWLMRHYYVPHSCTLYYFEGESQMTDWYAIFSHNYETTKRNCCDESKVLGGRNGTGKFWKSRADG
jgi:hypothetical protein